MNKTNHLPFSAVLTALKEDAAMFVNCYLGMRSCNILELLPSSGLYETQQTERSTT